MRALEIARVEFYKDSERKVKLQRGSLQKFIAYSD